MRKVCDTARSADTLFAQGEMSRFNRTKSIHLSEHSNQLKTSTAWILKRVQDDVVDNEHSKYISFTQEECKRLATVNEVNSLFLRKVNHVQNATTMSEASPFNLRKVK
ncbi:hypothetical protein L1077_22485 [Pseudoalteromonas luteoviolacea]|uniref:hypothetical protein n=1 Tax=Pseudoalteromonas luteoviolacea TaxID=43657 RepID=UPI001F176D1A|nr:hypothetical protein [Pseudoalteromonas luteoviolacea]MCF6442198.1 hypothetical protein [Pseudoalteromonas luteoviolacea]